MAMAVCAKSGGSLQLMTFFLLLHVSSGEKAQPDRKLVVFRQMYSLSLSKPLNAVCVCSHVFHCPFRLSGTYVHHFLIVLSEEKSFESV